MSTGPSITADCIGVVLLLPGSFKTIAIGRYCCNSHSGCLCNLIEGIPETDWTPIGGVPGSVWKFVNLLFYWAMVGCVI